MRVAVSGASGRLGRALVGALEEAAFVGPSGPMAWSRPDFDLDAPDAFPALLDRDRPEVVVHAAAWTDVDGCARDPELAVARNGLATGRLAEAAAERGIDLIVVSTNEVFDGRRTDGRGYTGDDPPSPINPYGASKLAGEVLAREAYASSSSAGGAALGIVRTAWLYGPPGNDFPAKILKAGSRPGRRRAAPSGRRRDRLADVCRRSGRGDRGADRRGRRRGDPPHRQRRPGQPGRLGSRGAPPGRRDRGNGERPGVHLAARLDAARVGRARADAAARRRAAPAVAGGPRRLPTAAPSAGGPGGRGPMTELAR